MKRIANYFSKQADEKMDEAKSKKLLSFLTKIENSDVRNIFTKPYADIFGENYNEVIKHPININDIKKILNMDYMVILIHFYLIYT